MYTLHLEAATTKELIHELQSLAAALSGSPQAVDNSHVVTVKPPLVTEPEKPKKPKAEKAVKEESAVVKEADESVDGTIGFGTVKDAMLALAQKKGREATLEVLGKFQDIKGVACGRVTSVQEKDYKEFLEAVEKAMVD